MNPSDAEFEDDYYNSNYGMMKSRKIIISDHIVVFIDRIMS